MGSNEPTLQELIEQANGIRVQISHLNAEAKALEQSKKELEIKIMLALDEQGLKMTKTDRAAVSITEEVMPQVDPEHWPEVWKFIVDNELFEVMRKQLNSTSFRELKNLGIELPHTKEYVLRKLNLRSV